MCYIALMAVVDCLNNLAPQEFSLELWHLSVWLHLQIPMQAASIDVLHYEKHLLVAFKNFVQLGNVIVVQLLHDFHLALDRLSSVRLHEFGFLVNLDRDLLV